MAASETSALASSSTLSDPQAPITKASVLQASGGREKVPSSVSPIVVHFMPPAKPAYQQPMQHTKYESSVTPTKSIQEQERALKELLGINVPKKGEPVERTFVNDHKAIKLQRAQKKNTCFAARQQVNWAPLAGTPYPGHAQPYYNTGFYGTGQTYCGWETYPGLQQYDYRQASKCESASMRISHESDEFDPSEYPHLKEYLDLLPAGWRGVLPPFPYKANPYTPQPAIYISPNLHTLPQSILNYQKKVFQKTRTGATKASRFDHPIVAAYREKWNRRGPLYGAQDEEGVSEGFSVDDGRTGEIWEFDEGVCADARGGGEGGWVGRYWVAGIWELGTAWVCGLGFDVRVVHGASRGLETEALEGMVYCARRAKDREGRSREGNDASIDTGMDEGGFLVLLFEMIESMKR
ncbi:hypothetical protein BDZ91DRAFT_759410 [Kalaharituber pfeilii]|nr:hypothetical protein BDZ91DRAFT_759410 [Kalaharituber pfeilii]